MATAGATVQAQAPAPGSPPASATATPPRPPATFPGQQRPPGDPTVVARGEQLYAVDCKACHGGDLRGGDLGGPNLLRSQVVLGDSNGEIIAPVVRGGRPNPQAGGPPMPPFPLADDDIHAVIEYIHSIVRQKAAQGAPPPGARQTLNLLVGNSAAGERYFQGHCAGCHSPTGDLAGIATHAADIGSLQDAWVSGRRPAAPAANPWAFPAPVGKSQVTVTLADGTQLRGELKRVDDFVVSLVTDDGQYHSFTRDGISGVRAVDFQEPLAGHRRLLGQLTDRDLHDVTAYLATLK